MKQSRLHVTVLSGFLGSGKTTLLKPIPVAQTFNYVDENLGIDLSKFSSTVFRSARPFHPQRLWDYLNVDFPNNILRTKGLFWIAALPDYALNFSQAGGSLKIENAGNWWASMPLQERLNYADYQENRADIESRWDMGFGDRLNELVLIGQDMDKDRLNQELTSCLLNHKELICFWQGEKFENPFESVL